MRRDDDESLPQTRIIKDQTERTDLFIGEHGTVRRVQGCCRGEQVGIIECAGEIALLLSYGIRIPVPRHVAGAVR